MDTLAIKGMQFRGLHGVHEHEKKEGNDFEVDVIFNTDLSKPATSDQLADTIDYTKVYKIASDVMNGSSKDLIEHLCNEIGNRISKSLPAHLKFEVAVRKLNPPLETPTHYTEARLSWPR